MKGASGPNITQVVNPVSKYRKHASSAFQLPLFKEPIKCFITRFPRDAGMSARDAKKKADNGTHALADVRVGGVASSGKLNATAVPPEPTVHRKATAPTT